MSDPHPLDKIADLVAARELDELEQQVLTCDDELELRRLLRLGAQLRRRLEQSRPKEPR